MCPRGTALLLPDVVEVAQCVMLRRPGDIAEQLWRAVVVVCLGCGGPGMATYEHIAEGTPVVLTNTVVHCPAGAFSEMLGSDGG